MSVEFNAGDVVEVVRCGWYSKPFYIGPDGQEQNLYTIMGRRGEVVSPLHRRGRYQGVLVRLHEYRTYTLEKDELVIGDEDLSVITPLDLLAEAGE